MASIQIEHGIEIGKNDGVRRGFSANVFEQQLHAMPVVRLARGGREIAKAPGIRNSSEVHPYRHTYADEQTSRQEFFVRDVLKGPPENPQNQRKYGDQKSLRWTGPANQHHAVERDKQIRNQLPPANERPNIENQRDDSEVQTANTAQQHSGG